MIPNRIRRSFGGCRGIPCPFHDEKPERAGEERTDGDVRVRFVAKRAADGRPVRETATIDPGEAGPRR